MKMLLVAAGLCMGANAWAGAPTVWGDGTGTSWTSPTSGPYYSGSTISLKGVTITLGSADDASHGWNYHSGNKGLVPTQMPNTDGTASTLITSFSEETFGTLPTKGCFLKIVPTEDGKVTIDCQPSTGSGQSLVFVTATADDPTTITAAAIDPSTDAGEKEYNVTNGNVYYFFQLASSGNLTSNRFTLRGVSFTSASLSEAYLALQTAYNTAKAFYDASVEGTGLFCYPSSARDTFKDVLDGAKTLLDGTPTDKQCTSQTTEVNTALATFKAAQNKPGADKYYYLTINDGALYVNMNGYDAWDNGDLMPVLSTLPYAIKFEAKDASKNEYYVKNAEGKYYVKGASTYATNVSSEASTYFIVYLQSDGTIQLQTSWQSSYRLALTNANRKAGQGIGATSNNFLNFTVTEATEASATANITSAQWATFVAPFAVELPTGVTAYTCTYTEGTLTTTATGSQTVAANTPVLLYSESTYNKAFTGYAQSYWSGLPESNSLVGTLAATTLTGDGTIYLLQKNNEVLGWYRLADEAEVSSTANRAYLKVPAATSGARQFIPLFDESETTGITQVNAENVKADDYYNLKGQRVSQPTKGLYIVGGRKVMVK